MMMKHALALMTIVTIGGLSLPVGADQGGPLRVFVAAQGADGNPCTFAQPCRTFQHAHDVVAANGEIDVLDPAGYGALTITKAISIQGHGFSGISTTAGNSITVNAGPADAVFLNGLLLDGGGLGSFGIVVNSAQQIEIVNSVVRNYASDGIYVHVGITTSAMISNVSVFNNHGSGVHLATIGGSGNLRATLDRVTASNNGIYAMSFFNAVGASTSLYVLVTRSVVHTSNDHGISIQAIGASNRFVMKSVEVLGDINLTGNLALLISNVTTDGLVTGSATTVVMSDGTNHMTHDIPGPSIDTWTFF